MKGNIVWSLETDARGQHRPVPYSKGAVYPYSSKRQDERNLRKLVKAVFAAKKRAA